MPRPSNHNSAVGTWKQAQIVKYSKQTSDIEYISRGWKRDDQI